MKTILPAIALLTLAAASAHATSSGCAVVRGAPDGFIELKAAPGREHETVMRLLEGEKLWVDSARCTTIDDGRGGDRQVCDDAAQWMRITSVPRLDDREGQRAAEPIFTKGWAEIRFLKTEDCEE